METGLSSSDSLQNDVDDFAKESMKNNVEIVNGRIQKIPRPMNAFMLFAHENRKRMQLMFPELSNKEVSTKLGLTWRNLKESERNKFFSMAKKVEHEHKERYPNYQYSPGVARQRKRIQQEEKQRLEHQLLSVSHSSQGQRSRPVVKQVSSSPPTSMYQPVAPKPYDHPSAFRPRLPPSSFMPSLPPCRGLPMHPSQRYHHSMMPGMRPRSLMPPGMFSPHHPMMPYRMGLNPYACPPMHHMSPPSMQGMMSQSPGQHDGAGDGLHQQQLPLQESYRTSGPVPCALTPNVSYQTQQGSSQHYQGQGQHYQGQDTKRECGDQATDMNCPVVYIPCDSNSTNQISWPQNILSKSEEAALCRYVESISQTSNQTSIPTAVVQPGTMSMPSPVNQSTSLAPPLSVGTPSPEMSYMGPAPPQASVALSLEEAASQYQVLQNHEQHYASLARSDVNQVSEAQATPPHHQQQQENDYVHMAAVDAQIPTPTSMHDTQSEAGYTQIPVSNLYVVPENNEWEKQYETSKVHDTLVSHIIDQSDNSSARTNPVEITEEQLQHLQQQAYQQSINCVQPPTDNPTSAPPGEQQMQEYDQSTTYRNPSEMSSEVPVPESPPEESRSEDSLISNDTGINSSLSSESDIDHENPKASVYHTLTAYTPAEFTAPQPVQAIPTNAVEAL